MHQDVEAAAALYHPDAAIAQIGNVHGGSSRARGADGIRTTMAACIGLKPHLGVVTHHTTVAGDIAMTRSPWLLNGVDVSGRPTEVHHHGIEIHRRPPDGTWVSYLDHPSGGKRHRIPNSASHHVKSGTAKRVEPSTGQGPCR